MALKTTEQLLVEIEAKNPSDDDAKPPRIALVEYARAQWLAVLEPVKTNNTRAAELYRGVCNAGRGSMIHIKREHVLEALGAIPAEVNPEDLVDGTNNAPTHGAGTATDAGTAGTPAGDV